MRSTRLIVPALAMFVLATACGSDGERAEPAEATTPTTAATGSPRYAARGPYTVGYTTLSMNDRSVAVWYPADETAAAGAPKATYDQRTPLPDELDSFVPPEFNTVVMMNAYTDVAANAQGPFPIVLFSHGATAFPMASSALLTGIASWGFVVVAVDYRERGVVTQLPGQAPLTLDAARDRQLMLAGLDLVTQENGRSASVLHGVVDDERVAAVGHSAGGTTAFDALSDPRVGVAVGWASLGPPGAPAAKPSMIVGASNDLAVTPAQLAKTYESLAAPKRRVVIAEAGHQSFTDLCVVTKNGGGMVRYAIDHELVAEPAAKLLMNGCEPTAAAPDEFWPVVQHFTVAEIRAALGLDASPVGLGPAIERAFPSPSIEYEQQP
jgi:predicted dienelactone hydrolase